MRHKPALPPSARLVILTLRTSPSPLTYRQLETQTDLSLVTLKEILPSLVKQGLLNREIVSTSAYFTVPAGTEAQ